MSGRVILDIKRISLIVNTSAMPQAVDFEELLEGCLVQSRPLAPLLSVELPTGYMIPQADWQQFYG